MTARSPSTIALFGHFDSTNFGNESSLQAILHNLRSLKPNANLLCISTGPETTSATYHICAIPIAESLITFWRPRNRLLKVLRKICIAVPAEVYRWVNGVVKLRHADMLIVPGTGLLTDAYGLLGWGPYTLLRWSLIAKLCGCRLFLVSVGAGPIYTVLGRWSVKCILSLAYFRSYRDDTTLQYLKRIGCRTDNDRVYPDLAFSLPDAVIPRSGARKGGRCVVGVGVMGYAGKYSVANPTDKTYDKYLEDLTVFVKWLLARQCEVRLLIGDLSDAAAIRQFRELLGGRISPCDAERIVNEPIRSVDDLLTQISATDIVVATRFHNVLLSLVCIKPVISISFHHKCRSLMDSIGLSEYCVDINKFTADQLITKFCELEENRKSVEGLICRQLKRFKESLAEQYGYIFETR